MFYENLKISPAIKKIPNYKINGYGMYCKWTEMDYQSQF